MTFNIHIERIQSSDRNLVLFTGSNGYLQGVNYWQGLGEDRLIRDFVSPDWDLSDFVEEKIQAEHPEWLDFTLVSPHYWDILEFIDNAIWTHIKQHNQ
jgi:hypothetical protein